MDIIATEIRRLRVSLGMTLQEFGHHVGVPWQSIAHYEEGQRVPGADSLLRIMHRCRRAKVPFRTAHVARVVSRAA